MTSYRSLRLASALSLAVIVAAACNGRDNANTGTPADSGMAASLEKFKARKATADSLIRTAPTMQEVVTKLGSKVYAEANAELTAAVLKESEKTANCYTDALKQYDANLSVVLYVLVNLGGAGWDLMRVEHAKFSSDAGGAVVSCINGRAKAEWKLPTKGIKPGAHLVKITYTPPDSSKVVSGK